MKRKYLVIILGIVSSITIILVVLGLLFNKTDLEKINGFTGLFAISKNGDIAYVNYNEGKAEVYIYDQMTNPIITLDVEKEITDMTFSPDRTAIYYVVNDKSIINSDQYESAIYHIDLKTLQQKELLREQKIITEITFDPKDDDVLYYLGAETFENYSPIVRAAPHDFDIYSYSIKSNEVIRHTKFKKYNIASLQISDREHIAYVQMIDDTHVETANETFEAKQKIFEIPLENPEDLTIISDVGMSDDIYDMYYMYQYDTIIFQAVSQTSDDGIYEYELFALDMVENEKTQLTYLNEFTAQPTYSFHDDKLYFIVDKQFAKRDDDYHLYRMNRDGSKIEEVHLNE